MTPGLRFHTPLACATRGEGASRICRIRLPGSWRSARLPRLLALHSDVVLQPASISPTPSEIAELARLVLGSDLQAAAAYVIYLKERGLAMETLFVELLHPAQLISPAVPASLPRSVPMDSRQCGDGSSADAEAVRRRGTGRLALTSVSVLSWVDALAARLKPPISSSPTPRRDRRCRCRRARCRRS